MKQMKKIQAPLFLLMLLTLVSCGSTRYAGTSSKVSDIPEFAFLKPCAYMVLYDTDGGYYNQDNTDIATDVITNIINSERFPFTEMLPADYQGEDSETLKWAKNLVDIKKNQVDRLRVPKSILKRMEGVDNRYGILIYSRGYNMTQEAYDKERLSKAASQVIDKAAESITGIGGLTNPSRSYIPSDPYGNSMVCVVIDKVEKRVIYYAQEIPTFASHPKDNADVSKLLHKLLKDFIR
jgi:hypothetical protein